MAIRGHHQPIAQTLARPNGGIGSGSWSTAWGTQWLPMAKAGDGNVALLLDQLPPACAAALPKALQCICFKLGIFYI